MKKTNTKGKSKFIGRTITHQRGQIKVMELVRSRFDGNNSFIIKVLDHLHDKYKKDETFIFSGSTVRILFSEDNS